MDEVRHQFREDLKGLEVQTLGGLDLVIQQLNRALESISYQDVELAAMVVADDDLRACRARASLASALLLALAGGRSSLRIRRRSQGVQGRVGVDPPARNARNRDCARLDRLLDLLGRRCRHERERERRDPADDRSSRGGPEKREVAVTAPGRRVLARGGDTGTAVREPIEPVVLV